MKTTNQPYYVYVMQSSVTGEFDISYTTNVEKYLQNINKNHGYRKTFGKRPWILVYMERYARQSDARIQAKYLARLHPTSVVELIQEETKKMLRGTKIPRETILDQRAILEQLKAWSPSDRASVVFLVEIVTRQALLNQEMLRSFQACKNQDKPLDCFQERIKNLAKQMEALVRTDDGVRNVIAPEAIHARFGWFPPYAEKEEK